YSNSWRIYSSSMPPTMTLVQLSILSFTTYTPYDICLFFFSSRRRHTRSVSAFLLNRSSDLIRNGRSASLQRTFKKSFTSFSHSTRNKTRDGLIRVRNIRALNGRFNTSITHAYSIVIGSKHITLNATGGGFLT